MSYSKIFLEHCAAHLCLSLVHPCITLIDGQFREHWALQTQATPTVWQSGFFFKKNKAKKTRTQHFSLHRVDATLGHDCNFNCVLGDTVCWGWQRSSCCGQCDISSKLVAGRPADAAPPLSSGSTCCLLRAASPLLASQVRSKRHFWLSLIHQWKLVKSSWQRQHHYYTVTIYPHRGSEG